MIGFILKLMLTRGVTMKRWNNFPRIEDVSHLDNVGYVIHIALFLAYLEEKNGKKVDREFLIKRIIFNSFSYLLISDINSGTREYIRQIDSEIFSKIEEQGYKFILLMDAPESIKKDIFDTINDDNKKLELLIISVAKKYAGLNECLVNHKIYSDIYEVPLDQINSFLYTKRSELKSLDILLTNENYKKYLSHIRRLNHSMRWSGQTRIFPVSVMSHLVIITFISYVLGKLENDFGANLDIDELMLKSIYHDIPEAITGDIITPTKKSVDGFEEVLEQVEIKMMDDYIFSYVDSEYKKKVSSYMLKPFEGELGKMAKYADIFSALLEAKVERNYGGKNYSEIYRNIKKRVNKIELKSIDYMLKNVIDSFDEKIDDVHLTK
ncbi:MAG: HD domain-containing protein [Candidatus Gracilibacteria bacterium]|nr:HD domain-containing protein [Candidatus Gracilibacteria bacterium]